MSVGSTRIVAAAICALLAMAALGLVARSGPLPIDLQVADLLRPLSTGWSGGVLAVLNVLGLPVIWDSLVALVGVALWIRGHRWEALVLVIGLLAAEAGATAVKLIVDRPRPPGVVVPDLITQAGYPSGHMTRAVVTVGLLTWIVARRWPRWLPAALAASLAVAVAMGVARIAVGEHWFSDVLGAALFSVFSLLAVVLIARLRPRAAPGTAPPSHP